MNDLEIERGYKLTIENAQGLIEEADGLMVFERYSRAYSLYQLAIEEVGKCSILNKAILDYYMGTLITEKYLKDLGFVDHKKKTRKSLILELRAIQMFEEHIGKETGLKQGLIQDFNDVDRLNQKKNRSLYVDIEKDKFVSPITEITKEMAEEIQEKAQIRLKVLEPIWQPLAKIKRIADELKVILENPEKVAEMEKKLGLFQ